MERSLRSPKEEKLIKSNTLNSVPSRQIIPPFDRFPNFNKWIAECRLQHSSASNSDSKNSAIKKGYKHFETKNPDPEGMYNKNKMKNVVRGLQESKADDNSKITDRRDNRTRNEKINKTKTFEDFAADKKEKLTKKDDAVPAIRKRPHTASPTLSKMNTRSDSIRKKNVPAIVENKSVMMEQKLKKENVVEKKLTVQKRPNTSIVLNRPRTPTLQNRPQTAENRPCSPNVLFKKQDYSNSRGDKKIQKIVEKVDGSCVFIKTAVPEKLLKKKHSNIRKGSNCSFFIQKMRAFTDSNRTKRINMFANEVKDSSMCCKTSVTNQQKNKCVENETFEDSSKSNIGSEVSIMSSRPQSADGKLQSNCDSLNNFVDEMERSFLSKNLPCTSKEKQINDSFLKVPKLESIVHEKKKTSKNTAIRPQSANGLLQKADVNDTESYSNFVEKMQRSYPRYNFSKEKNLQSENIQNALDKPNAEKQTTENKVICKNKDDNKTKTVINKSGFNKLNEKMDFVNDWILGSQPGRSKSLSHLEDSLDFEESKIRDTSQTVLRDKIEQYVKICIPDMCGKKIIKSIEGKIDDLERVINAKLKLGYQSTDLGNHFPMFKEAPDAYKSPDKNDVLDKTSGSDRSSNKYISNAGLIKYMDEKIEAYEKRYSYNFCNEAFIVNLQDKVDALQKNVEMMVNVDKPSCQDVQCFTSDLSVKKVGEAEQEQPEVWEVAVEEFENEKNSMSSNLDKLSFKSLTNDLSKPQIVKQNFIQTKRPQQSDKPLNTIEDAKRVLAQAQNLFTPQKAAQVKSSTAVENSRQKMYTGMNKTFNVITAKNTQKSPNIEEYKNFLKKYKIVNFDDPNSNRTQSVPTSKVVVKGQISNTANANATTASYNKEFEEMCAERHVEVIENLQKRIEHFKKSSRISELRSKIDQIKSSISRVTHSSQNSALELDNNNVSVICAVKNYLEESDSVMETSCEDLLKVTEDITNLDEEIKHCKTQLAFYQSKTNDETYGRNEPSSKLVSMSEKNSRCTFSPKRKYSHRSQQRPKSANLKYSKSGFGGITKIIKNLQTKIDQHEKFYQSYNQIASAITNDEMATFEQNRASVSNKEIIKNHWGPNSAHVILKASDLLSAKTIENLQVKVDSLTETCNVSNIRELQKKLENIEKACSVVTHADIIKTLQAKIEKLENTLENQSNFNKRQDSTETLYSCSSSKTFTNNSFDSRVSTKDSNNLFDEMPACTYCMAVTLDHKQNILNWDKK